ncbi:hypothetical protein FRC07_009985 [Ceratobasidium sp. 392]|nr:hypothetical protein FRC07_009985 [Ceratobasidium sp. 392]
MLVNELWRYSAVALESTDLPLSCTRPTVATPPQAQAQVAGGTVVAPTPKPALDIPAPNRHSAPSPPHLPPTPITHPAKPTAILDASPATEDTSD